MISFTKIFTSYLKRTRTQGTLTVAFFTPLLGLGEFVLAYLFATFGFLWLVSFVGTISIIIMVIKLAVVITYIITTGNVKRITLIQSCFWNCKNY